MILGIVLCCFLIIFISYNSTFAWSQKTLYEVIPTTTNPINIYNIDIAPGSYLPNNTQFYVPQSSDISAGTEVMWTNKDIQPHTVTFVIGETFDSNVILPRQNATYTFFKHGTFEYYCMFHPYMNGQLTVH